MSYLLMYMITYEIDTSLSAFIDEETKIVKGKQYTSDIIGFRVSLLNDCSILPALGRE